MKPSMISFFSTTSCSQKLSTIQGLPSTAMAPDDAVGLSELSVAWRERGVVQGCVGLLRPRDASGARGIEEMDVGVDHGHGNRRAKEGFGGGARPALPPIS